MKAPGDFRPERLHRPDWYCEKDGEWRLRATRCRRCGRLGFPAAAACSRCWPADVEDSTLPETGRLLTWTVAEIAPAAFRPPYAFGYVDVEDGVRLFGQIEGDVARLAIDMPVDIVLGTIRHEADGAVWGYKFKPCGGQA